MRRSWIQIDEDEREEARRSCGGAKNAGGVRARARVAPERREPIIPGHDAPAPALIEPGRSITDPDEAEAMGLTVEARRMRAARAQTLGCRSCGLVIEVDDEDRDCPLCHAEDGLDEIEVDDEEPGR